MTGMETLFFIWAMSAWSNPAFCPSLSMHAHTAHTRQSRPDHKAVKARYKAVNARYKAVNARYKAVKARPYLLAGSTWR